MFDGFKQKMIAFAISKRSFHRQTFALMIQNLIADTIVPQDKSDEWQNQIAEAIFETHFKSYFVAM